MTDSATITLVASAAAIALVGGARSTWSPCGLSMLSTITPIAERGRGHRWGATATWYLAGSIVGGATLGTALGLGAAGVHAITPATTTAILVLASVATLLAALAEAGVLPLPIHHRQVNERWLDAYRPWVYATGFGWQIGTGVATYIKTSAVYALIALAALTGKPLVAVGLGTLFGLVRGLAVFATARVTTATALASFHRRFMQMDRPARTAVVVVEVAAALALGWTATPWLGLTALATVAVAATATVRAATRSTRRRPETPATSPGGSRTARTA